jgi:molybdate transport system substrate-binding protein
MSESQARDKHSSTSKSAFSSRRTLHAVAAILLILLASCRQRAAEDEQEITVAAAANLTDAFSEIAKQFTEKAAIRVIYSFGSTADLAKQIENGGPFDVFASADVEHIDRLGGKDLILADTRAVYARGRLVLWGPELGGAKINRIEDVTRDDVKTIAIAKPDLAPYGLAAVETLKALNLWSQIESKVVYGTNVSITKQYAKSGTPISLFSLALVKESEGHYVEVDERLHSPINQALVVIKTTAKQELARRFVSYVLGENGRAILRQYGYGDPLAE